MATYPIKMLRDEDGNPFIPVTSSESLIVPGGSDLTTTLETKLEASNILSGSNIRVDKTGNNCTINVDGLSTVAVSGSYTDLTDTPDLFSGDYNDLSNKPTIPTTTGELTNDSGYIDITALDNYATEEYADNSVKPAFKDVSYNTTTGVLTFLKVDGTTKTIDLPTESLVESGYYDDETKEIVLNLSSGDSIKINAADLMNEYFADDVTLELKKIDGKLTFNVKEGAFVKEEIDPTVPAHVKAITVADINKWNDQFDGYYNNLKDKPISYVTSPTPDDFIYLVNLTPGAYVLSGNFKIFGGALEELKFNNTYVQITDWKYESNGETKVGRKVMYTDVETNTVKYIEMNEVVDSDQDYSIGSFNIFLPKASVDILGGIKVGQNLVVEEDGTLNALGSGFYVLPIATADTLGGIKVGNNLQISEDGLVNLAIANADTLGGIRVGNNLQISEDGILNLAIASADTLGGIRIGANLTIDENGVLSTADVLSTDNEEPYTPTGDFNPATKKYVDDRIYESVLAALEASY